METLAGQACVVSRAKKLSIRVVYDLEFHAAAISRQVDGARLDRVGRKPDRRRLKKNDEVEQLRTRVATLELALEGRLINVAANSLLGRNAGIGTVELIPAST